jgi:hypothetical protein
VYGADMYRLRFSSIFKEVNTCALDISRVLQKPAATLEPRVRLLLTFLYDRVPEFRFDSWCSIGMAASFMPEPRRAA